MIVEGKLEAALFISIWKCYLVVSKECVIVHSAVTKECVTVQVTVCNEKGKSSICPIHLQNLLTNACSTVCSYIPLESIAALVEYTVNWNHEFPT